MYSKTLSFFIILNWFSKPSPHLSCCNFRFAKMVCQPRYCPDESPTTSQITHRKPWHTTASSHHGLIITFIIFLDVAAAAKQFPPTSSPYHYPSNWRCSTQSGHGTDSSPASRSGCGLRYTITDTFSPNQVHVHPVLAETRDYPSRIKWNEDNRSCSSRRCYRPTVVLLAMVKMVF